MIELDAREVARVSRDVSEQEKPTQLPSANPREPGPASQECDRLGDASVLLDEG